jgi:hypothetical protein
MENEVNSKSIILNNGVILGIASILISVTLYALGAHLDPHWSTSVLSGGLFIGLIVVGITKYKEANGGFLSWGQGVKIGVGISIIAALLGVVYNYIFMNFIEPDFMTQIMDLQNQKLIDQGMSEEQIEATNALTENFKSPGIMAATGIIASAIGGFIISAIVAAIMKKSQEEQY